MSLDLYLKSKKPRNVRGTGVFVRRNGANVELKTIDEVLEVFPDADVSGIQERMYETNNVFDRNITHNLCEMAENAKAGEYDLYKLLWHPEDSGFTEVTEQYRNLVLDGYSYLVTHRKDLEKYNPDNGWGSYDSLLNFVSEYCNALSKWDGTEQYEIYAST